jgi:hypothetical protein
MKSGNGSSTLFWTTKWIGEIPLALAYPRLFSLPNEKDGKVGDLLVIDGERRSGTPQIPMSFIGEIISYFISKGVLLKLNSTNLLNIKIKCYIVF